MHVQHCYFANPNLLLIYRFRFPKSLFKQLPITETTPFYRLCHWRNVSQVIISLIPAVISKKSKLHDIFNFHVLFNINR